MSDGGLSRRELLAVSGGLAVGTAAATRRRPRPRPDPRYRLPSARRVAAKGAHPADLDAVECAALLRARMLSSSELLEACIERVHSRDPAVNAWVRVYEDQARAEARAADERLSRRGGRRPPLVTGIPVGLKDLFAVAGRPLTASSRVLEGHVASADSTVWARLKRAGMVLLGHTHTHEFALQNYTPQTANPWDHDRSAGGSSGGSGAALAERTVPLATGTDTLGSQRVPASFCGVSTIKPTFGMVSTFGVVPLAWTLDNLGPMARSAADLGLLLGHMAAEDPRSAVTLVRRDRSTRLPIGPRRGSRPLAGLRVGVPDQLFGGQHPTAEIGAVVDGFRREMHSLGAILVPFAAPGGPKDNPANPEGAQFFFAVAGVETDSFHRQFYPQRAADYTPDSAAFLAVLRARATQAQEYIAGQRYRAEQAAAWADAFAQAHLDVVVQPAAIVEPPRKSEAVAQMDRVSAPMFVWNYTGFPVAAIPAGRSSATGLPVGVQLAARPGREALILQVAIDCQHHFPHHAEQPPGLG